MGRYIVILGEAPTEDRELIEASARKYHGAVELSTVDSAGDLDTSAAPPVGYVSFVPCRHQQLLEVFSAMPIGAGQRVPFFQNVPQGPVPAFIHELPISSLFTSPLTEIAAENMFATIAAYEKFLGQNKDLINEVVRFRKQKHQLIKVSTALTSENDLDRLLELILAESRDVMLADAGSIYVRERAGPGKGFTNRLLFKVAQNDSVDIKGKIKQEIPIDIDENTIAGYVAFTGKTLNIKDVYRLDDRVPYRFGKDFDRRFNYRMKSMLTVPLKDTQGTIVGVLQLMNKKREKGPLAPGPEAVTSAVLPFSPSEEDFVVSIASLAAVSIERAQLYEDIQNIFEGFLDESIATIDERDRVTSGHSRRVMGYAIAFAEAADRECEGPFALVRFPEERKRQFKFAALLHDIGKIGVPEGLLTKESRLPAGALEAILSRLDSARKSMLAGRDSAPWDSLEHIDGDMEFLRKVNASGFLGDDELERLAGIRTKHCLDSYGRRKPILEDHEWHALSVRKGNLTDEERAIINSHTDATRRILSKIPWTRDLEGIPDIAAHHHEKLDGSGYPDGLREEQISLESKILAVVDIYEALTAQDRPYKPAMSPERAIGILRAEVEAGHLDRDIVDFFVDKELYTIFLDQLPSHNEAS
jgi:HD-GYP domain-containing protein (c-di-GMP phosphodiesterase class II)